jgi:hypothetical protein
VCVQHDVDAGVSLLEPILDAADGIGTVYECVLPTIVPTPSKKTDAASQFNCLAMFDRVDPSQRAAVSSVKLQRALYPTALLQHALYLICNVDRGRCVRDWTPFQRVRYA